jgi:hypothetical protein
MGRIKKIKKIDPNILLYYMYAVIRKELQGLLNGSVYMAR